MSNFKIEAISEDAISLTRTNLLESDEVVARLAKNHNRFIVEVNSYMTPEESHIFYRNLIRLTAVHKITAEAFQFQFDDHTPRTDAIAEQLKTKGFTDIVFLNHYSPQMACEPQQAYGTGRFVFKNFYVTGVQHYLDESNQLWQSMHAGDSLILSPEPDNKHDSNAVAVLISVQNDDPVKIGYIPRSENNEIAALLNAGWSHIVHAEISQFNPEASCNARIGVTIYVIPNTKASTLN
ncbi:MAG: HIRAN domain-containing protein [Muribaculaceae bacterium]|nr:HIRAN domain-containing protein [Muribaculaceae bacterium]